MTGGAFMAGSIVAKLILDKTGWDQSMGMVRRQNEQLAANALKTAGQLQAVGAKLAILGGAVVGAAAVSVAAFTKFDDALTQSMAIMGDVTIAMRKDLTEAAREVSRQTTFSATKAAQAFYYLASAGMDAKESVEALPVVAKFAQAGMFDLEKATTLLADAQTALGLRVRDDAVKNMENMTRVADVLSRANILANASIEQLSEALTTRAGAALRMVGKSVEEGAAALAVMANQGIKGAEAGTRLDIVLRDLQTRSIKNKEVFEKYGVTVFDTAGEMMNLADIMADLEKVMAGMSDEQRRMTLMEMDFQDRSVASILSLIGMSEEIRRYEKDLKKAAGTTDDIANKQLKSLKSQIELTKNAMENLAEVIGGTLAPVVGDLAKGIRGIAEWFTKIGESNRQVLTGLALATVGLGALSLAAGTAVVAVGMFLTQWAVIATAAPAVAGSLALVGTALGSLGAAILAVAVGFAAFKIGEWFFRVTKINKLVEGAATGVIKLGQQLGLVRKPVEELEASEYRLQRRHLFLATASGIAGREINDLGQAFKIARAEFEKTGTTGDATLDTFFANVKKRASEAAQATKKLPDALEQLDAIVPGLSDKLKTLGTGLKDWMGGIPEVAKWWDELGKKMEATSPKAKAAKEMLDAIFTKYDIESRTAITQALEQAKDDLEVLRASTEATPGAIAAVEAKIDDLKDKLSGFTAVSQKVGQDIDWLNRRIGEMKDEWSKAAGIDFDELLEFQRSLAAGVSDMPVEPIGIDIELDEGSMLDGKAKALSFLEEIQAEAATASNGVTEKINEAMRQLGPGALEAARTELAILTMTVDKFGDQLPVEQVREMKNRIEELKAAVADPTPWGRFVDGVANAFRRLEGLVTPIINQLQQNQEIAIENEYKKRLDMINQTVTDEEAKQRAITALEAEYEIKKSKARAAAAKTQKAFALMGAIVNTAEAVTKALAQGGFILGIPWAAIVGAMGAVQVAAIAAQPIPAAKGFHGVVDEPTTILAGEAGRERVDITPLESGRGQIFTGAPALAAAGAGSAFTINFSGPLIQTTGISRADLEAAGEEMTRIVDRQLRRVGRRL